MKLRPSLATRSERCVVDISGSMRLIASYEGDDGLTVLDVVKHAVKTVMHTLGPDDRLALVAFDNMVETAFALGEMNDGGRKQAVEALEALQPRGTTNIWGGLHA